MNTLNHPQLNEKEMALPDAAVVERCCLIDDGIFIREKDFHRKFLYANILWIEASGNYCSIHLTGKHALVIIESISCLEKILPSDRFVRIHRSYIVNMYAVDSFIGNMLCIGRTRLSVSAPYRLKVLSCFTILDASKVYFRQKKPRLGKEGETSKQ